MNNQERDHLPGWETARKSPDAVLVDAAGAVLRDAPGACARVRIPNTFPEQFVCVGTSDQILRLLGGHVD